MYLVFSFLLLLVFPANARSAEVAKFSHAPFTKNKNTLLSIDGFDPAQSGTRIVYFHGHNQTLEDVRRDIAQQVEFADLNAVLIAPRLFNGKVGKFVQEGFFAKYMREASEKLAAMAGDATSPDAFEQMPVIVVFYSGGYKQAKNVLKHGGDALKHVRGVVNFDGAYNSQKQFAEWIGGRKNDTFFVSIVAETGWRNEQLKNLLRNKNIGFAEQIPDSLCAGDIIFADMPDAVGHFTITKRAWIINPLKDLLDRIYRCSTQTQ